MLKIRLTRVGKKNSPAYRIVVAEHTKAVKRKFVEIIGHYNPAANPKEFVVNKEKALAWIGKGAQVTPTVNNLFCDNGVLAKDKKVKTIFGKPTKKKDAGKEATPEDVKPAEEKKETAEPVIEEETKAIEPETETAEAEIVPEPTAEGPAEEQAETAEKSEE